MIKSRRMRWAGHIARMEEKRNACNVTFHLLLESILSEYYYCLATYNLFNFAVAISNSKGMGSGTNS
jgi:hypothetical protein